MKFQLHSMSISNNKLEVQKANIPSLRERERERERGGGGERKIMEVMKLIIMEKETSLSQGFESGV